MELSQQTVAETQASLAQDLKHSLLEDVKIMLKTRHGLSSRRQLNADVVNGKLVCRACKHSYRWRGSYVAHLVRCGVPKGASKQLQSQTTGVKENSPGSTTGTLPPVPLVESEKHRNASNKRKFSVESSDVALEHQSIPKKPKHYNYISKRDRFLEQLTATERALAEMRKIMEVVPVVVDHAVVT